MANLRELRAAIHNVLSLPTGVQRFRLMRPAKEKAYEAYVFCLCLRAVRELGAHPQLLGISGRPNPFIFRGGPGQIHSRHSNYGYAFFQLNGSEFEIHSGVEFEGTSQMRHELDVCIMRAADARKARAGFTDPPAASLVAGWECKFYAGLLGKELGRAFVGLMDDMGQNPRLSGLCSNSTHPQLKLYLRPQRRPYPFFGLIPANISDEDMFINALKVELKKMTAF